jgi:hypothetical protein
MKRYCVVVNTSVLERTGVPDWAKIQVIVMEPVFSCPPESGLKSNARLLRRPYQFSVIIILNRNYGNEKATLQ